MLTFGSIFAGIGGFDLGFERAGMRCAWQVEIDRQKRAVLRNHWPKVRQYEDVRKFTDYDLKRADIICGGDPCQCRSQARRPGTKSRTPDMSGWFLAVVAEMRPRWVVRENVLSPDDVHFVSGLDLLGYGSVVVRCDAAPFTAQQRIRDYVIGCSDSVLLAKFSGMEEFGDGPGPATQILGTRGVTAALTCHRTRYDARDCFIWHPVHGLRILEAGERERLAGFPRGWTDGFSETARARMYGEAVVPPVAEAIGRAIIEAEE